MRRRYVGNSAGFRTRHTGHVPRGIHKQGPPQERASTKVDIKKMLKLYVILSVILCKLRYNYAFSTEIKIVNNQSNTIASLENRS